jgi:2-hydroxychromene-2-carboxylate isomerase
MTLTYDLFWSFRSPYSYLLKPRLLEFERDYDVKTNVRPIYPIAVRIDGFFKNVNPLWRAYLVRDVARTAHMLGMPFSLPNPDPIVMNLQTGEVPKAQPYISRLTRLGVAAAERGKGLELLKEVSATIFGGALDWHLGDHLAKAVARAGLILPSLIAISRRMPGGTRRSSPRARRRKSARAIGAGVEIHPECWAHSRLGHQVSGTRQSCKLRAVGSLPRNPPCAAIG